MKIQRGTAWALLLVFLGGGLLLVSSWEPAATGIHVFLVTMIVLVLLVDEQDIVKTLQQLEKTAFGRK